MSDIKLGQLALTVGVRDAVHVAVVSVVAATTLSPGQRVVLDPEGRAKFHYVDDGKFIGVVDPFLRCIVPEGAYFWLYLKPGTVSSLRHVWAHPAFPLPEAESEPSQKTLSHAWLLQWCRKMWPYESDEPNAMLNYLVSQIQGDRQICFGQDDYRDFLASEESGDYTFTNEWWGHYETYTGQSRPARAIQFRCAC